jgi:hypothetical protein
MSFVGRGINLDPLNLAGTPEADPVRGLGFQSVRMVPRNHNNSRAWYVHWRDEGLPALLVLTKDTFASYGEDVSRPVRDWDVEHVVRLVLEDHPGSIGVSCGNEPDGSEGASWVMSQAEYLAFHNRCAAVLRNRDVTVCTAGFSSGHPDWLDPILGQLDFQILLCHPYAKTPEEARVLVRAYRAKLGKGQRWGASEWHRGESDQVGQCLRMLEEEGAWGHWFFCWSDGMVKPLGLYDTAGRRKVALWTAMQQALAGPLPEQPEPALPGFQLGFERLARAEPAVVGRALADERYPIPRTAVQETSTGHLFWGADIHGHLGRDGTIRLWDGSRLVTVTSPVSPPGPDPPAKPDPEPPPAPTGDAWQYWSPTQIAAASGCPVAAVREHWPKLHEAMRAHHVDGRLEQMAAIGTVAIETASTFQPVREAFWVPNAEAWRRDNLRYYPFYGRGYIQLTWDSNYREYGQKLGFDLIGNPDLALDPFVAAMVLARYFVDRQVADAAAAQDWPEVRRRVQGAHAGLDRLRAIVAALQGQQPPPAPGAPRPGQLLWADRADMTDQGTHGGWPACDAFAPRGREIYAPGHGRSEPATYSKGGNACWFYTDPGQGLPPVYYLAHGNVRFRAGRCLQGEQIGQVGDSGNATGNPHLHFAGGVSVEQISDRDGSGSVWFEPWVWGK